MKEIRMTYCEKCGNEVYPDSKFCSKCGSPVVVSGSTNFSVNSSSDLKLAFWGERFVAWLIDIIILGVVVWFLSFVTWFIWLPLGRISVWFPLMNLGSGGFIYFIYWTFMEGFYGRSIGKMIMGLQVTRLDGRPVGFTFAAIESVGKSFFLVLDLLLGIALYPKKRQRIFNRLSETIVIKK